MCELTNGMGAAWARRAMSESALREFIAVCVLPKTKKQEQTPSVRNAT